jgi:hypothetical protein
LPRETALKLKKVCEDKIDLALKNIEFARKKKVDGGSLGEMEGEGEDEITLMDLTDGDEEDIEGTVLPRVEGEGALGLDPEKTRRKGDDLTLDTPEIRGDEATATA